MYFHPGALVIGIITMLISLIVSQVLKAKFRKFSKTPISNGMSGAEIADMMLRENGLRNVQITCIPGALTDHYNPQNLTVNLSEEVYHGRNMAAAAVAAHECGHAVQHAKQYAPLNLRSALVPITNISGKVMNMLFIGMFLGAWLLGQTAITYGLVIIVACYAVFTTFAFVTLPVEFDATNRALAWINQRGIFQSKEHAMAKNALWWAAMTYVVAAIGSLAQLAYYVMLLLNRRD